MNNKLEQIKPEELASNLSQFIGTTQYYRMPFPSSHLYFTDGAYYLAEYGNCFWLFDYIASQQLNPLIRDSRRLQGFQLWRLEVDVEKQTGVIFLDADEGGKIITEKIDYTDFVLKSIMLFCQRYNGFDGWICMLPSEY